MGIHRARRGKPLVAPHLVEQPLAGDDFTPVLDQEHQEVELLPRHPDLTPRLEHLPAAEVDPRVAERELLELLPRSRTAQHRPHAGEQLAQREGLCDVIVGAQLEPEDAVHLGAARRQHDHGHVDTAAAELPADVPAAHPRHQTSSSTRSGASLRASARASSPLVAATVWYPSKRRLSSRPRTISGSSSAIKILATARQGEPQGETAPRPRPALDRDPAAMRFGHVLDERQAHATAPLPLSFAPPHTVELLEDPPLLLG